MKVQSVNVLIVDDIRITGQKIAERLSYLNNKFHNDYVNVMPRYYHYDVKKTIHDNVTDIRNIITDKKIKYLLLDRGFRQIINIDEKDKYANIKIDIEQNIYSDNSVHEKILHVDEVLKEITNDIETSKHIYKKCLQGIIVYTYSIEGTEPGLLKNRIKDYLPDDFPDENLTIIETNSEIYEKAHLKLHRNEEVESLKIYFKGPISEFKLYGLFMGEILYNHIRYHFFISKIKSIEKYKLPLIRIFLAYYISFIAINVGGNLIASYVFTNYNTGILLFIISLSIILPLFILFVKPGFFALNITKEECNE